MVVLVTDADNDDISTYNDIFSNDDTSLAIVDLKNHCQYICRRADSGEEDKNLNPGACGHLKIPTVS